MSAHAYAAAAGGALAPEGRGYRVGTHARFAPRRAGRGDSGGNVVRVRPRAARAHLAKAAAAGVPFALPLPDTATILAVETFTMAGETMAPFTDMPTAGTAAPPRIGRVARIAFYVAAAAAAAFLAMIFVPGRPGDWVADIQVACLVVAPWALVVCLRAARRDLDLNA